MRILNQILQISNLNSLFKPIRNLSRVFLKIKNNFESIRSVQSFSKIEELFWNHPSITHPSVTIKKILGQKTAITNPKSKSKKCFLGGDIRQKEIKLGLHRGPQGSTSGGQKTSGVKKRRLPLANRNQKSFR